LRSPGESPWASDSSQELADWLECEAIASPSRTASLETLVRALRQTGSTDALEDDDDSARQDSGSVKSQEKAGDAIIEIESRATACGSRAGAYPFSVDSAGVVTVVDKPEDAPYVFLLLLSYAVPSGGHSGSAVAFEELCRVAALNYLGGDANGVEVIRFGSPRKPPLTRFGKAVEQLCTQVGEGAWGGSTQNGNKTGDRGLDIVAWRRFPDGKPSKLVTFGQCASGRSGWGSKLNELNPEAWGKEWLRQQIHVEPVRLFFVPWCVSQDEWNHASFYGGILFDRCRIVSCLTKLETSVETLRLSHTKRLLKPLLERSR